MYKSSSQTFFFRFIFPIIFVLGFVFMLFQFSGVDEAPDEFLKGMTVMLVWVFFHVGQVVYRTRVIETSEEGLYVKNLGREHFISYRNIEWISRFHITSAHGVSIKYRDIETGADKIIAFMPPQGSQKFLKEDGMTAYIRKQIEKYNPDYSKENQPSTIKNILTVSLLSLPFIVISIYFANGSFAIF